MLVIGLVGGIGTGKTTVAFVLRDLGAVLINADEIAHETYEPGTSGWQSVVDEFGAEILAPDGRVDRKKLGDIVFQNRGSLEKLNSIVHPRVRRKIEDRLDRLKMDDKEVVVVEVPLLVEAVRLDEKWGNLVDEIWVTEVDEGKVLERVSHGGILEKREIKARIRSQISQKERKRCADVVVDNNEGLEELRGRVKELWDQRIAKNRKHHN